MSPAARTRRTPMRPWVSSTDFFRQLSWIDGRPLLDVIEPYRLRIFQAVLDTFDAPGVLRNNLALLGRAKKNWKSADLVLAALFMCLANDSRGGNQVYILANDEGQAGDDLELAKKVIEANPVLTLALKVQEKVIKRKDGRGFIQILPAGDVIGTHGKTFRGALYDEIHGYKTWALFEAMQPDPTRPDAQQWITSYASLYHKPGAPLFDLMARARTDQDARMFTSWYAADWVTDPALQDASPEARANPSLASFAPDYLAQQAKRLPGHQYRRLHLNLPGLPEGSAFTAEMVMGAVARGVKVRPPQPGVTYCGFVDMSGGSSDDAVLAIAHRTEEGRLLLDLVVTQGGAPPFDPRQAVARFVPHLTAYGIAAVWGDNYGGRTFFHDFASHGLMYYVTGATASQIYEGLEPLLNAGDVSVLDLPHLEQQALGLVWKGGKITHPAGEHDDLINAAAGALILAREAAAGPSPAEVAEQDAEMSWQEARVMRAVGLASGSVEPAGFVPDDTGRNYEGRNMSWYQRGPDGARQDLWTHPAAPDDGMGDYVDVKG